MIILTLIAFVLIFSLVILIHEMGHFLMAKKAGVKVEEFGIGLPPRLWGIKKGETLYSINLIPFGGFVRLLGVESDAGLKAKLSPGSFSHQSIQKQIAITASGVVMNFLLAFVLLTIGFLIGIEPLIASEDEFLDAVRDGQVEIEPGIVLVEAGVYPELDMTDENGNPYPAPIEVYAYESGDTIVAIDGEIISSLEQWETFTAALESGELETAAVLVQDIKGELRLESFNAGQLNLATDETLLDVLEFLPIYLPRLVYVKNDDALFADYLEDGDVLVQINGSEILTEEDLYEKLQNQETVRLRVYRPGVGKLTFLDLPVPTSYPVISYVEVDSPAEEAGLRVGDRIMSVGGEVVIGATDISIATQKLAVDGLIAYEILRDDEAIDLSIPIREDGRVGIGISDLLPDYGTLSFYGGYVPNTIMGIEKVRYGISAPIVAVTEMWRLGKVTAVMFTSVFGNFLTGDAVPAGVAGPVGIAQMTFVNIQNGFAAVLRFVALLSLSLGVINILPIPALDGGRLVFILYRGITGHKPNERIENFIHFAGFVVLLLFILYITFYDVLSLF